MSAIAINFVWQSSARILAISDMAERQRKAVQLWELIDRRDTDCEVLWSILSGVIPAAFADPTDVNSIIREDDQPEYDGLTASYSVEDNKLRLYAQSRLPAELYARVKAAGFAWAPKQQLFVAPTWTPARENLLLELCGEIDDEDYSPEERAADRAERFSGYRDKRRAEAHSQADRFDAGPSAFGHQNRTRAERQAARHNRLRGRAVSQWSKAEYWQERTAGVIAHALYKSSPEVRRGRILRLEAELRKVIAEYTPTDNPPHIINQRAYSYSTGEYLYGGEEVPHVWCGPKGRGGRWVDMAGLERLQAANARWVNHYEMRLTYERAMIEAEGGSAAESEIEPGGWIGSRQVQAVSRSPVTKRVTSVKLWSSQQYGRPCEPYLKSYNIERLGADAYRAPTDEERAAFATTTKARKETAKATKPAAPALINPTDEDAQKLQDIWNAEEKARFDRRSDKYGECPVSTVLRMTQAEYSACSGGTYSKCETSCVSENCLVMRVGNDRTNRVTMFKVRTASAGGSSFFAARRVVVITDKPQKPLPWIACEAKRAEMPTIESVRPHLQEIGAAMSRGYGHDAETQRLIADAAYVGLVHASSITQAHWSEVGAAMFEEFLRTQRETTPVEETACV